MLSFHALTVREVRREADDALRLTIDVPEALADVFRGKPGQHIVLRVRLGSEEIRRTYSLTGAAGELPLTLGIRMQGGRCTGWLAGRLQAGDVLELMPPFGRFGHALGRAAGLPVHYVAFAAGSGITPILSIVRAALAQPASTVTLFYGNRNTGRSMFLEDLQELKNRYMDRLALHFFMSAEPQEVELLNGRLDAAKVRTLAGRCFAPGALSEYFICGPGAMVDEVRAVLQELGVPAVRVHSERFAMALALASAIAPQETRVAAAPSPEVAGGARVSVRMDGRQRTFMLRAQDTVLEGAERAGLALPYSCRSGVCSTCRVRLTQGRVVMTQNNALEPWELEQGFILACQAHAQSAELALDYDER
jgi:ring-1,2-phenylacetyl-CoA epoxidase subunit PaaE